MSDSALHERLLDFTYGLILTLNRQAVEDGNMTEEELLAYADEQIQSIEKLPTDVVAQRLLEEIPEDYCGWA